MDSVCIVNANRAENFGQSKTFRATKNQPFVREHMDACVNRQNASVERFALMSSDYIRFPVALG